jgi:hypothetical protein
MVNKYLDGLVVWTNAPLLDKSDIWHSMARPVYLLHVNTQGT